jgi:hypothetical protein
VRADYASSRSEQNARLEAALMALAPNGYME